jgi:hypothetical protein
MGDVYLTPTPVGCIIMPKFTISPSDQSRSSAELICPNVATVLHTVARLECGQADIFEDEKYVFSLQLSSSGLWQIYQRNAGKTKYLHATA